VTESAAQEQEAALPPSQVEELMQFLAKAQRAQQLYLPNNPVYQKALENLRESFRRVWEATDDLVLDVGEHELRWEDNVVYSQANRSESFSWVFYKDGVRRLTLLPGIEDDEIVALLEVVQKARALQAEDNDDLLTLLWEKDFQRFQYVFQEIGADTGLPLEPDGEVQAATDPYHVRKGIAEDTGDQAAAESAEASAEGGGGGEPPPRRPGIVRTEDFDTTLYFLDEREIEYIRAAVAEEYSQDIRRNVLAMLYDVMELQPYATVRTELISILENFLPYLLGAADFASVAYVLRESKAVTLRARELMPEHREALGRLAQRLSEEQALSQLLQSLDEASVHPAQEELTELFGELKPEALPTLFAWLSKLNNARVREVVEAAVQRLAVANAPTVIQALNSPEPNTVIAAARVSGRMKIAPTVPGLAQAMSNPEALVRVAVVTALAEIATPSAVQALEKGLDDADREVRITSVRVVSQHRSRTALPKIAAVVQGKAARPATDLTERMAFYEAYGSMVGEAGVPVLEAILGAGGGFLKRKEDPQTRACAAMALGRIGTQAAKDVLQKSANDKDPLVKSAVNRALRGDRSSTMVRAGELPT
jgi:HEAT repeat protein